MNQNNITNKKSESVKPQKPKVGISKSTQKSSKFPAENTRTSRTSTGKIIPSSTDPGDYQLVEFNGRVWQAEDVLAMARKAQSYKAACVDLLLNCKGLRATIRGLRFKMTLLESPKFASFTVPISNISSSSLETKKAPTTSETTPTKTFKNTYDFNKIVEILKHEYNSFSDKYHKNVANEILGFQNAMEILGDIFEPHETETGILPKDSSVRFHVDKEFIDEPQKLTGKSTYYFNTKTHSFEQN